MLTSVEFVVCCSARSSVASSMPPAGTIAPETIMAGARRSPGLGNDRVRIAALTALPQGCPARGVLGQQPRRLHGFRIPVELPRARDDRVLGSGLVGLVALLA